MNLDTCFLGSNLINLYTLWGKKKKEKEKKELFIFIFLFITSSFTTEIYTKNLNSMQKHYANFS